MTQSFAYLGSKIPAYLACLCIVLATASCSWMPFIGGDDDEDGLPEEVETSEQKLYKDSQRFLRSGNYQNAITALEGLEARFPFGRYAEQAQLELIYARYMVSDFDGTRAAADRFIRLHPQHSNVDYAFYIKGLASFNQNQTIMDRLFESDSYKRDMAPARDAYADFANLLTRYPNSQYVADTKQRMVHLRNVLGRYELSVADYYLKRAAYVAAANRARYVLETFPNADATPDALLVLVEANYKLGLDTEANNALRVLSLNYPSHPAFDTEGNLVLTERIRNRDRSWTNIMTLGLLDRPDVPPPIKIQHPEGFTPQPVQERNPPEAPKPKKRGWFSWLPFVD